MTEDEAIERIIKSLDISTMKEWRAQDDADVLRRYGLWSDGHLKPSRIRAAIRRLRKSPDRKRRNRTPKKRPYPKR